MMKLTNVIAVLICFGLRFAHAFAPPFSRLHAAPRSTLYFNSREVVLTKRLLLGRRNEEVFKTEKDCGQKAFVRSSDIGKSGSDNLVDVEPKKLLPVILITGLGLIGATVLYVGSLGDTTEQLVKIQSMISDPQSTLEGVVEHVKEYNHKMSALESTLPRHDRIALAERHRRNMKCDSIGILW